MSTMTGMASTGAGRWTALADITAMTWRNTLKNRRNLDVVMFATAAPITFALLFAFIFGSAIDVPNTSYREFLIVGILAQTMMMTATNTGVAISQDMAKGLIDRFRSLPISPAAVVAGRTTSDVAVNLLVITVMTGTGLLIGWRIRSSVAEAALAFALLILFAYAVSWVCAYIGLKLASPEVMSNASFMFLLPLTFISNAFVPAEGLPVVLRQIAEWSPVSALVAACRELFGNVPAGYVTAESWPMQHPVAAAIGWIVLILAIFVPLSVRQYKISVGQ